MESFHWDPELSYGAWEVGSPQSRVGSKDTSRHVRKEGWGKAVCAHPRVPSEGDLEDVRVTLNGSWCLRESFLRDSRLWRGRSWKLGLSLFQQS